MVGRYAVLVTLSLAALLTQKGRGDESAGPLAGWPNANADFEAVGDGVADDTVAVQVNPKAGFVSAGNTFTAENQPAIERAGTMKGRRPIVPRPAGTYSIHLPHTLTKARCRKEKPCVLS